MRTRVNIPGILRDPRLRKALMVGVIIATQAREGITTTVEQAEAAYDKVHTQGSPKDQDQDSWLSEAP